MLILIPQGRNTILKISSFERKRSPWNLRKKRHNRNKYIYCAKEFFFKESLVGFYGASTHYGHFFHLVYVRQL